MRLHGTTINEIVKLVETYAGHREERRLKQALSQLDLSVYTQNSTGNEVLVPTKELLKNTNDSFQ